MSNDLVNDKEIDVDGFILDGESCVPATTHSSTSSPSQSPASSAAVTD